MNVLYSIEDYDRPSVAADAVVFGVDSVKADNRKSLDRKKMKLLLVERGEEPFKGCFSLPGGFLRKGETIEETAVRELKEEAGVIEPKLIELGVYSKPDRDPRGWIISNAYVSVISEESVRQAGRDDASDAQWFSVSFDCAEDGTYRLTLTYADITVNAVLAAEKTSFGRTAFRIIDRGGLAFDHAAIIAAALSALRTEAKNYDTVFDFLPEKFTLTALQKVQETIMNVSILPANFRRMVSGYVEETDEYLRGEGHRPARLYRRKTIE